MSEDIRKLIDKVKNLKQSVNENYNNTSTEFIFNVGLNTDSKNNLLNYRKITELLIKQTPVSLKHIEGNSSMGRPISTTNIKPSGDSKNVVEYECIPQIKTKTNLKTIRDTDTIDGAIQTIQRYVESIYNDRID